MDWAARNNHLHIIQWLYEHRTVGMTKDALDTAIKYKMRVRQWLREHYERLLNPDLSTVTD
jgi:hypothetical protein